MPKISLCIDGREIEAAAGASLLETALEHGIYIPHLCHDPDLKPHGGCRLCLVAVRGARGFPAACTTQVADGMVVTTTGAELDQVRRDMLEILLTEHPLDCLSCAKNQHCALQTAAAYIGDVRRNLRRTGTPGQGAEFTPCFVLGRDYCILCQKCVRACDEIAHKKLLTVVGRGGLSRVAIFASQAELVAACSDCLECVKRCPTAALRPLP
ncbi:MAG: 2Fe-2S iron-sulfur cluster-binding protein [Dehalococcoidia bacterium]|nr:2Fe-2S iron-sulfur cluster-binding protein [Dehalococcoidia bacterium]